MGEAFFTKPGVASLETGNALAGITGLARS
jgi:hypothetical protein